MSRIWTIAAHQLAQDVLRRGFLLTLFSMPFFVALTIGIGYLNQNLQRTITRLGYVDQAGVLVVFAPPPPDVQLTRYETSEAAQAAVNSGQIDAFYLLNPDFVTSQHAELVYRSFPQYQARSYFEGTVRQNLLAGRSPEVVARALSGATISARALISGRVYPTAGPTAGMFAPIIAALFFAFLVMILASTLLESLVKEKENRTMEVIISSISPSQMMTGKIIGGLGVTIVLLTTWLLVLVLAVWLGARVLDVGWLQNLNINWRDVGLLTLVALPSLLCITALMTMIGATMVEVQEAQQVGPLMLLGLMLPIYFVVPLAENPNSVFAIAATLFPFTAVSTIGIRSLTGIVPTWQYAAAALIGLASGVLLIWLAGKAFRLSILRYGQRLHLRALWRSS